MKPLAFGYGVVFAGNTSCTPPEEGRNISWKVVLTVYSCYFFFIAAATLTFVTETNAKLVRNLCGMSGVIAERI